MNIRWVAGGLGLWLCLAAPAAFCAKKPAPAATNAPSAKAKALKPPPAQEIFEPGPLRTIEIQVVGEALKQLRQNDRQYARATFREGDEVIQDVGVHVKGAAGSRRGFDDLPALTVNFDKFVPDQRWRGLGKIHLNNSVQDASKLQENICGELFRQAGVPATRAGNVRVKVNGRDLGVYVIKEGFDKVFLKQYFQNAKGNLYDGGFCHDIDQPCEKLSGNTAKGQPELKALFAAAQEPDLGKRWTRLEQLLDMDRFISFCALQVMMYDWDGYVLKPNNYKLYWNPDSGKITFFPHGMDQMFWEPRFPITPGMGGFVARSMVETPEGKRRYLARMTELTTNVFKLDVITNRINAYAAPIRAALAERDANRAREYDGQAQHLRNQIVARTAYLKQQLVFAPPKALVFRDGAVQVKDWQTEYEASVAMRVSGQGANGKDAFSLVTGEKSAPSWRARVMLPAGRYRFEASARTAGVAAMRDEVGEGAGVRISGARQRRENKLTGDAPWQKLQYEFEVDAGSDEVVLVCELRATKGQAWFDADSLRLVKVK